MSFSSPPTTRSQLISLVAISVLPIWLVAAALLYVGYVDKRDLTRTALLNSARSLTLAVDQNLTNVQSALQAFATSPTFATGDLEGIHREARLLLRNYPGADIILADRNGQQLVNSYQPFGSPLPVRTPRHAVVHVFGTGSPVVSDMFYGAVTTGRPMVSIDIPVVVAGKVAYDLAMTLPVDSLSTLLKSRNLAPAEYASILDGTTRVAARSRNLNLYLGKQANPVLRRALLSAPEGCLESTNLEQKRVLVAYCRSASSGWTVTVGVSKSTLMEEVYLRTLGLVALATLLSIAGVVLAAGYARRISQGIQALVAPALAMGRGEPVSLPDDTGIKETGEVAAALSQASELLFTRTEELRVSERRYKTLFQNDNGAMAHCRVIADEEGRPIDYVIMEVNGAFERILGIHRSQVEGRRASHIFPGIEGFAFDYLGVLGEVAITGRETAFEAFFEPTSQFLSLYAYSPLPGEFTAIFTDITSRKLAERLLQESEEKYRALFDNAGDAILIYDSDTSVLAANPQAASWLGYRQEDLSLMKVTQLLPVERGPLMLDRVEAVLARGALDFEAEVLAKGGSVLTAQVTARRITWSGRPAVMSICHDITGRKLAEEARLVQEASLMRAQKLESLGLMAGGIAHDFNNILMAVLGSADLALMCLDDPKLVSSNLLRITEAGSRAANLTRQMLAYSGKGKFVLESIDLSLLVEKMVPMLHDSLSETAQVKLNLDHSLPPVHGDASQLSQILSNLVVNACEALGEQRGMVTISTGMVDCDLQYLQGASLGEGLAGGGYLFLEVADNGCGMTPDTLSRIYDPFFSTKFLGRGLGLAAVQGIVRGHKGAIKVWSEPGMGTVVKVLLPPGERVAVPVVQEEPEQFRSGGTVLLVDDEEAVRNVAVQMLGALGFFTITAVDGTEAVKRFGEHPDIDLVILDLTMPRMSGERCLQELRRLNPELKVILSSGYSEQDVTERFHIHEFSGFIQKPYNMSALAKVVKSVTSASAAE
ncbi:hypothetical protein GMSM_22900 [Geomonas sp. Red276]